MNRFTVPTTSLSAGSPRVLMRWLLGAGLALALAACGDSGGSGTADDTGATGTDTASDAATGDVASDADTTDVFIPPLEKISKVEFKLNGVSNSFDINGNADYISAESQLKISAAKGLRKIEINVLPVEDFAVGQWEDTVVSEVGVVICFTDGASGQLGGMGPCASFTHQGVLYNLTISKNNGVGSFVEGTFTATLADANNATVELTEGTIDVKHK